MPPAGELEFDDMRRGFEHRVDIVVALRQVRGFGVLARRELARHITRVEDRRQRLDVHLDQIGGVLRNVWIFREHGRDRIADVAHLADRKHRLAIGRELLDRALAKIDRADVGNVVSGMELVDNIKKGDEADNGTVTDPDRMIKVRIAADK